MKTAASFITTLALGATVLASCYGSREAGQDKQNRIKSYHNLLDCRSGWLFAQDLAEQNYKLNSSTVALNANIRMDKRGVYLPTSGSRKLIYDYDHGVTLQCYDIDLPADTRVMTQRFYTPMQVVHIDNKKDTNSFFSKRFNQVKEENMMGSGLNVFLLDQKRFSYNADSSEVIESVCFEGKNRKAVSYIYALSTKEIFFQPAGGERHRMCTLENASQEMTEIFHYWEDKKAVLAMKMND